MGHRIALGAERNSVLGGARYGARPRREAGLVRVRDWTRDRIPAEPAHREPGRRVGPNDPVTFIGVPLVLLATALVANLIPALRATRIDPISLVFGG